MSFEKLKNVLNKISQDTILLKKFSEKVSVETVNLLKQNGYDETEGQMQQDILKLLNINEEELELVSGGVNFEMNKFKKISAIALAGLSMSPNFAQSFGADPKKISESKEQPKNQVVAQKTDTKTENKPNAATNNTDKPPLKPAAPSISKTNTKKGSSGAPIDFAQIGSLLGAGLLGGFGLTQMLNTFVLSPRQKEALQKQLKDEQDKVTKLNQEIEKLKKQSGGPNKENNTKIQELEEKLKESEKKVEELTASLGNGNEAQQQLLKKQEELEKELKESENKVEELTASLGNGNEVQQELLQKQEELDEASNELAYRTNLANAWKNKAGCFEQALNINDKKLFMEKVYTILALEYPKLCNTTDGGLGSIVYDVINMALQMYNTPVKGAIMCTLEGYISNNTGYFEDKIIDKEIREKYKKDGEEILSVQSILDLYKNSQVDKVDCFTSLGLAIEMVKCVSKILCEKLNNIGNLNEITNRLIALLKMFEKGVPESKFILQVVKPLGQESNQMNQRSIQQQPMGRPPMSTGGFPGQLQQQQPNQFIPMNQQQPMNQSPQQNQFGQMNPPPVPIGGFPGGQSQIQFDPMNPQMIQQQPVIPQPIPIGEFPGQPQPPNQFGQMNPQMIQQQPVIPQPIPIGEFPGQPQPPHQNQFNQNGFGPLDKTIRPMNK